MQDMLPAVYRNGAFVPVVPCDLPEETKVRVIIDDTGRITPALEKDPHERARIRKELVARMQHNPIPANSPRFTRDELHERR
ncbi:MAG TPA: antitoxin family protein [Lacipirellulaceae bacterium]|nr:antitoxin family protein [Lacipirellulaceae bacterium]